MPKTFNNPKVLSAGWYALSASDRLSKGRVLSYPLFDRRIALFRSSTGIPVALDSRCPHLGADLSRGCVVADQLQCEFHHWRFGTDGVCKSIPYRQDIPPSAKVFSYPVCEKFGYVWVFNGPAPFPFPSFEGFLDDQLAVFTLPTTTFQCHPHIINSNGLDIEHMRTLHNMDFAEKPRVSVLNHSCIKAEFKISLLGKDWTSRFISRLLGKVIALNFTTWGGNMSTGEVLHPHFPLLVLFNHVPTVGGGDQCRTFFFLPKKRMSAHYLKIPYTLMIMKHFLGVDVHMLNKIRFWSRLTEEDFGLQRFIEVVNKNGGFDPRVKSECDD